MNTFTWVVFAISIIVAFGFSLYYIHEKLENQIENRYEDSLKQLKLFRDELPSKFKELNDIADQFKNIDLQKMSEDLLVRALKDKVVPRDWQLGNYYSHVYKSELATISERIFTDLFPKQLDAKLKEIGTIDAIVESINKKQLRG